MHHLQILNRAKTKTTTSTERESERGRRSRSRSWHRRVEERYMLQLLATKEAPGAFLHLSVSSYASRRRRRLLHKLTPRRISQGSSAEAAKHSTRRRRRGNQSGKEWKIEEKKPKWKGKHKAILCVFKMRQLTETTKAREEEKEEGKGNTS